MKNIAENNLIRFINITKKKEGMFANFKVHGIRGGMSYKATISIDLSAAEVDPTDPLEKIIERCANIVVREWSNSKFQFEGIQAA